MSAQYLLRLDDLCPTMDRVRWRRFVELIERYGVKPILAVVPDNRDPGLMCDAPDPNFWEGMRRLEMAGAAIGLHGFQHLCNAEGRSLMALHRRTEFAGAPMDRQRAWIRAGLAMLREHGLDPRIWVAPRHGFDRATLAALREEGMELVSDGFADQPFRDGGMIWIPQQLWGPAVRKSGVWTICLHPNSASEREMEQLEQFLQRHSSRFTSVERVVAEWTIGPRSAGMRLFHARLMSRIWLARMRKRLAAG